MKVAIVHYWLVGMRGGEKVLENICSLYPDADIYTHVYAKKNISNKLNKHKIKTTFINYLPFAKNLYKYYLPLMPLALKLLDLKKYDLIISSESGPSKGFKKKDSAIHVCYCHSPMRYLYDMKDEYLETYNFFVKKIINWYFKFLQKWDMKTAQSIDLVIANSSFVSNRIRKYWHRDAIVIHPTINCDDFYISTKEKEYYLIISELVRYKRIDIAIRAFNKLNKKLYVIGSGPLLNKYKKIAKNNIKFFQNIDDSRKSMYLSNCRALIFPGIEDFGITPIEAMASGRPVIAFKYGGVLDYMKENINAFFFEEQTEQSLINSINNFEIKENIFKPNIIMDSIKDFNHDNFKKEFRLLLADSFQSKL